MMLSSDALERQFGPTKLEILRQEGRERISCTKARGSGQVLELSRVVFRVEGITAFPEIHRRVLGGISMGTAFKETGVQFKRDIQASYRYVGELPAGFAERFDTRGAPTVTNLLVLAGPDSIPYADILEVYSPAVAPWEPAKGSTVPDAIAKVHDFGALLTHTP